MLPKPPIHVGPFILGMNNRLPDTDLRSKDGAWLRSAINADIHDTGRITRRPGVTQAQAGTDCHSLWSGDGEVGFYVDGDALYQVNAIGGLLRRKLILTDLTPSLPVSYAQVALTTYWSNGVVGGTITDGFNVPWLSAAQMPQGVPGVEPLPLGHIVRFHAGRLLVARGDTIFYSMPFSPLACRPSSDFLQFLAPVTLIVPADAGIYIVADRTFWLSGKLPEARLVEVLPYGGVAGTDFYRDAKGGEPAGDGDVGWMSARGLVTATTSGEVTNRQEGSMAIPAAIVGASTYRERDGMRQALSSVFGASPDTTAARTWMQAEVIRKGTS